MQIFKTMITGGPSIYYDPAFRNMIEDHMTWLRGRSGNTIVDVEPMVAYKYAGDFFGLLMHFNILPQYHWITMRMNQYVSPQDYSDEMLSFVTPSGEDCERLRAVFMSQTKMRK